MNSEQRQNIAEKPGFIAALDQSGGSTPKALQLYGIEESTYHTDEEMFRLMHEMRKRIITAPAFSGDKIIGAILFERTMDSEIEGKPSADYLWQDRGIVPFLKIDKGLEKTDRGVRMMKPIADLDDLLIRAGNARIFGTKMRSVIAESSPEGIKDIVAQQFDVAEKILSRDLVPIIEPEISIDAPDKLACEKLLKDEIKIHLDRLGPDQKVMLKLTLPEDADFYASLIEHDNVLRVAALSGGYDRGEACARLAQNRGMIASFSRALTEGLHVDQTEDEFNDYLSAAIDKIYRASAQP